MDVIAWLFTLLTFGVAAITLFSMCCELWEEKDDLLKGTGEALFRILLIALSGFISWKTGKWVLFKPEEIDGSCLLLFWFGLIFIFFCAIAMWIPTGLGSQ